ncbi:DUF883 family protein [Nitrosomonas sp. JL21]|nr:DUF883 family protein [Nitrosomonas sp.]MXS77619.1 DUF883 family protein [Nitrosomonas sp. JL21]
MKNVNKVVETVSDLAQEAMDKTTKATHQAADTIVEKSDQLRSAEQRLLKETSKYIRDNPLTSVGIAVGVGFILSKWFNNSDR